MQKRIDEHLFNETLREWEDASGDRWYNVNMFIKKVAAIYLNDLGYEVGYMYIPCSHKSYNKYWAVRIGLFIGEVGRLEENKEHMAHFVFTIKKSLNEAIYDSCCALIQAKVEETFDKGDI